MSCSSKGTLSSLNNWMDSKVMGSELMGFMYN